ncbi:hypothetical protein Hanom_Chr12g01088011 [Helianthus anomalus]
MLKNIYRDTTYPHHHQLSPAKTHHPFGLSTSLPLYFYFSPQPPPTPPYLPFNQLQVVVDGHKTLDQAPSRPSESTDLKNVTSIWPPPIQISPPEEKEVKVLKLEKPPPVKPKSDVASTSSPERFLT